MTSDASQFPDRDPTHNLPRQAGADRPPANRPPGSGDVSASPERSGGVTPDSDPAVQAPPFRSPTHPRAQLPPGSPPLRRSFSWCCSSS
jgi:hypothetical protein